MHNEHHYSLTIKWSGNKGTGTSNYKAYERSHIITINQKPDLQASADPAFRGDPTKHNPEDLMVASLSSCHMLSYLYVCTLEGIIVVDYIDNATATMIVNPDASGQFTEVTLSPVVTITDQALVAKANELHKRANQLCFIANSVNFPIHHNVIVTVADL